MLTSDDLREANIRLNEYIYIYIEYPYIYKFFRNSQFYLIDQNFDFSTFQEKIESIQNTNQRIVIFNFIEDENKTIHYLSLYTNGIGFFYDFIIGTDILDHIFDEYLKGFVLIPIQIKDKKLLSNLIDLSNNYFLESQFITETYDENLLDRIVDLFYNKIYNETQNDYFKQMIKLIVYYIPLISIASNNFQLNPSNFRSSPSNFQSNPSKLLPEFEKSDFFIVKTFHFYYNDLSLLLYKKTFEFYFSNYHRHMHVREKFLNVLIEFYNQIYLNSEYSFIIPCYGIIKDMNKTLIYKFICKRFVLNEDFIKLNDTDKSLMMYNLLAIIITLNECGFYTRCLTWPCFIMDNENNYYLILLDICKNDNNENKNIGTDAFIAPKQYHLNYSSPITNVYSWAKIINSLITGEEKRLKYSHINDSKLDFLFDECLNLNEDKIPDSFTLFIQMHEKNIFFPKTNKNIIDKFFKNFMNFILRKGIKGGKYSTSWTNILENSKYKSIILNDLKLSFIIHYSRSELEEQLNKLLNERHFEIEYTSTNLFKINFLSKELHNDHIARETDEIINKLPIECQNISKLILYDEMKEISSSEEEKSIDDLYDKEKLFLSKILMNALNKLIIFQSHHYTFFLS